MLHVQKKKIFPSWHRNSVASRKIRHGKKNTDNQIGKSHDYPQNRKPYSTSRAGVGDRSKKMEMKASGSKSTPLTYFDKLLKSQNQKGKNLNILVIALEYFNIDVRMSHFRISFL